MKLAFENLGPLKKGQLDLSKNLIVLTGPNNTGKSYITYLIHGISKYESLYGITKNSQNLDQLFHNPELVQLLNNGDILNVHDTLSNKATLVSQHINSIIRNNLVRIFASSQIKPDLNITIDDFYNHIAFGLYTEFQVEDGELYGFHDKDEKEKANLGVISADKYPIIAQRVTHFLGIATAVALDVELSVRSYFFPAERTAINLFAKHITSTKAEIKDDLDSEVIIGLSDEELGRLLRAQVKAGPKYPYAIRDYINFVNDFKTGEEGELAEIATNLEAIMGGKVYLDQFDQLKFTPVNAEASLELHLSSSLVKSLSYLVLYLRYIAKEGNQIIIDEPELNLHPDLQVAIAKAIAQMVNAGLKVIISTHSDYLIKELNNLILLGELNKEEQHQSFAQEKGFAPNELLTKNQVGAYFLNDGTIDPIDLDENGLVVPTINEAIRRVDGLAEEIYMEMEG